MAPTCLLRPLLNQLLKDIKDLLIPVYLLCWGRFGHGQMVSCIEYSGWTIYVSFFDLYVVYLGTGAVVGGREPESTEYEQE